MMMELFDCVHRPVSVQLVLPVRTATALSFFTYTANLLWPMRSLELNMRSNIRPLNLPVASACSLRRGSSFSVSQQTGCFFSFGVSLALGSRLPAVDRM